MRFVKTDKKQYERLKQANEIKNKSDDLHLLKVVLEYFLIGCFVIFMWIPFDDSNTYYSSAFMIVCICFAGIYYSSGNAMAGVDFPIPIEKIQKLLYLIKKNCLKVLIVWIVSTAGSFGFDMTDGNLHWFYDLVPTFMLFAMILYNAIYYSILCFF